MKSPRRSKLQIAVRVALVLQLLILVVIAAEIVRNDWPYIKSTEEVGRVTSPDGKVDALLVSEHYYMNSDVGTWVYLVPKGQALPTSGIVPIMGGENIRVTNTEWISPQEFLMTYEKNGFIYRRDMAIKKD